MNENFSAFLDRLSGLAISMNHLRFRWIPKIGGAFYDYKLEIKHARKNRYYKVIDCIIFKR